nr:MAG TPA: hypothetical protein [Caudoviricetes sp.]
MFPSFCLFRIFNLSRLRSRSARCESLALLAGCKG